MKCRAALVAFAVLVALPWVGVAAQVTTNSTGSPLGRALMSERNGAWADAAKEYIAIIQDQPANVAALVGLEHVLPRLNRQAELIGIVEHAMAIDSGNASVLGVAVRVFAGAGLADSARRCVDRWARLAPHDEDPYREWSQAALAVRDLGQARTALDLGRDRLGAPALGLERAELFQQAGDLQHAVAEWVGVVHRTPVLRDAAVTILSQVAATQRRAVTDALARDTTIEARQVLGLLRATWGDPVAGAAIVRAALPADHDAAALLLGKLYALLRGRDDQASRGAAASTLESLAAVGPASARARTLLDAARAWADAGDERNARRVLAMVAQQADAPPGLATTASTTLLGVLIAEGKAAEAEQALAELGSKVDPDEHDALARRIAELWARQGDLARADSLVRGDSSTEGLDLRGRLRLYRGDLAGASDLLKAAGPYDDQRPLAMNRVAMLTLIQAVGNDSVPALGSAMLALERGDTGKAVNGLVDLSSTLKPGGSAEARLLAARLALASGDTARASSLFRESDVPAAPAAAAAARLALARIDVADGHRDEARTLLEKLIVDYPESAVTPEARRLHDSIAGAIPAGGS